MFHIGLHISEHPRLLIQVKLLITKKINNNYFSFLADASDVSMGDILVENVLNRVSLKLNKNNIVSPVFITMHYITAVLVICYNLFPFFIYRLQF